jgi:hypothetical protein
MFDYDYSHDRVFGGRIVERGRFEARIADEVGVMIGESL